MAEAPAACTDTSNAETGSATNASGPSACDADPLALAAGGLVRKAMRGDAVPAYQIEEIAHDPERLRGWDATRHGRRHARLREPGPVLAWHLQ